jgi:hypothetical protein
MKTIKCVFRLQFVVLTNAVALGPRELLQTLVAICVRELVFVVAFQFFTKNLFAAFLPMHW